MGLGEALAVAGQVLSKTLPRTCRSLRQSHFALADAVLSQPVFVSIPATIDPLTTSVKSFIQTNR